VGKISGYEKLLLCRSIISSITAHPDHAGRIVPKAIDLVTTMAQLKIAGHHHPTNGTVPVPRTSDGRKGTKPRHRTRSAPEGCALKTRVNFTVASSCPWPHSNLAWM
jgi:hypothetical protein